MQLSATVPGVRLRPRSMVDPAEADAAVGSAPQSGYRVASADSDGSARAFRVDWARSALEVGEAQRLRFKVFAGEMGARLQLPIDPHEARDVDFFDSFCDHLLVRAVAGTQCGEVVATCRVLSPDGAKCAGRLYTDTEFDLTPLNDLLPRALEMGRVCVDPAWRNGLVVMALWCELGRQMAERRLDMLIGCSSISLNDGGHAAAGLWHLLKQTHLVAPTFRVLPRNSLEMRASNPEVILRVPVLLKAYLRCGGKLLGPPAIDPAFNTADFPMLMHLRDLPTRYGKRIFGASG